MNKLTKNQKDFIGSSFITAKGGVYKVIGFHKNDSGGRALFNISCSICDKDYELFPLGLPSQTKNSFQRGAVRCLCARGFSPNKSQEFTWLSRRVRSVRDTYSVLSYRRVEKDWEVTIQCSVCSLDEELYPRGSLVMNLRNPSSRSPCGCGGRPRWSKEQYKIKVLRLCSEKGYVFNGFCKWDGCKTYLKLHNPLTGNSWETTHIDNFLNNNRGDPVEGKINSGLKQRIPEETCVINIKKRLSLIGGNFCSWEGVYRNQDSKFTWVCKEGHLNKGYPAGIKRRGCLECFKTTECFYGYYPDRVNEVDNLYLLLIGGAYLKIGRSFNVAQRVVDIKCKSKDTVEILLTKKGIHRDVYREEQEILKYLRELGLLYKSNWSKETVELESLVHIEKRFS